MNPRFTLFLGPLSVLYLLADVASRGGLAQGPARGFAAGAVVLSLVPWWLGVDASVLGLRRVQFLAVAAALVGVRLADAHAQSPMAWALANAALCMAGGVIVDLSFMAQVTGDRARRRWMWRGVLGVAVLAATVNALRSPDRASFAGLAPHAVATCALGMAGSLALRVFPTIVGRGPDAAAANTWARLGLGPAVVALGVAALLGRLRWASDTGMGALVLAALTVALAGHVAMLRTEHRASASPATRALVTFGAVLALAMIPLTWAVDRGVFQMGDLPWVAALTAVFAFLAHSLISPVVFHALAPFGGRLLDAIGEVRGQVAASGTFDGLARRILAPLRRATADLEAEPVLFTAVPPREVRIDASGEPRVRTAPMPEAIRAYMLDHPSENIVRDELAAHVVRRPEVRALVETLTVFDALCVLPLVAEGELEGALVIPRGKRTAPLRMEELRALSVMAGEVASMTAVLAAHVRAEDRVAAAKRDRDALEEALELAHQARDRSEEQVRTLVLAGADPEGADVFVHYSAVMRELVAAIHRTAAEDVPVMMVGEEGTGAAHLAQYLHAKSARAAAPFVVGDCGRVRKEDAAAALFGHGARTGWLALAAGGTLFLKDVVALPVDVQAALALALAEKRASSEGDGAASYEVDVRVVASSRLAVEGLVTLGAMDAELARWLTRSVLAVPALRDRAEDVASLVLLALDRATRVLGREAMGMEPDALERLRAYEWPGNLPEVPEVVLAAVRACDGARVSVADLPPQVRDAKRAGAAPEAHPLDGTYDDLELRILRHALTRAAGNKSEAARLLGLKRTTFLDKLERYGDEAGATGAKSDAVEPS